MTGPAISDQQCASYRKIFLSALLAGILTCMAWWSPGTALGAALGWCATLAFCYSISKKTSYRAFYFSGLIINSLGFYWLCMTIKRFGGFSWVAAALIFLLFVALSAVQFLIFVFLHKNLPSFFDKFALRSASAWVVTELIAIRIFPWQMGHTQLGFIQLAQIADIAGTLLISFLMFWCAESFWLLLSAHQNKEPGEEPTETKWPKGALLSFLCLILALAYGQYRVNEFTNAAGITQPLALIQGNISLEEKHDPQMVALNSRKYKQLSDPVASENRLIIWPETALEEWFYSGIGSISQDTRLPRFENKVHFLSGALTFRSRAEFYNSALAIYQDGTVPEPAHKQILMPFGEYTPLGDVFPILRHMNSTIADFSAGTKSKVFAFPATQPNVGDYQIKLSTLICYEDIVPKLARQATQLGAELLVNLTNDAWFGHSYAALQHNLIASFRAIENRRFLARATNTGLSTIVNPLGQTISQLPMFETGTLLANVNLLSYKSIYTEYLGEKPWWILTLFCCLAVARAKLAPMARKYFSRA